MMNKFHLKFSRGFHTLHNSARPLSVRVGQYLVLERAERKREREVTKQRRDSMKGEEKVKCVPVKGKGNLVKCWPSSTIIATVLSHWWSSLSL